MGNGKTFAMIIMAVYLLWREETKKNETVEAYFVTCEDLVEQFRVSLDQFADGNIYFRLFSRMSVVSWDQYMNKYSHKKNIIYFIDEADYLLPNYFLMVKMNMDSYSYKCATDLAAVKGYCFTGTMSPEISKLFTFLFKNQGQIISRAKVVYDTNVASQFNIQHLTFSDATDCQKQLFKYIEKHINSRPIIVFTGHVDSMVALLKGKYSVPIFTHK